MKKLLFIVLLIFLTPSFAWDSSGHRLIAQIAYNRLNKTAKAEINQLTYFTDKGYTPLQRFLYDSIWPDLIKRNDVTVFDDWHYINYPYGQFTNDNARSNKQNIVWAIAQVEKIMKSTKSTKYQKSYALRFLIHLVGDAHDPVHDISRFSKKYPNGDKGANLVRINSPIARNLHSYWDRGAGLFRTFGVKYPLTNKNIKNAARLIERLYPAKSFGKKIQDENPTNWTLTGFNIAKKYVYQLGNSNKPSKHYQQQAQMIVEQSIALAGYQLAYLLNDMESKQ